MIVTNWLSALASVGNLILLLWLIRVTIRYVKANEGLLETNRQSLEELKRQYRAVVEREKRPFRRLIERAIRNLEEFAERDLIATYELRNPGSWPRTDDLLPGDFNSVADRLKEYDVDLHERLKRVGLELIAPARQKLGEMERLGRSGRATLSPELPQLQGEFRGAIAPVLEELRHAQQMLEEIPG